MTSRIAGSGHPSRWRIDGGLARDAADLLGWAPADGHDALVTAMGRRLAAGSMAKLAAIAAGEVPPGWDPAAVLRSLLTDARVGRPSPSWSCWVFCTVYAALLESTDVARCRVALTRRVDERAPVVDLHSSVLVEIGGSASTRRRLVDPYFYVALGGPGSDDVEALGPGIWALRTDETGGRWSYRVSHARWATPLRYRVIGEDIDRGDVHACCAISTEFTGVTALPSACLLTTDGMVDARQSPDGTATVRVVHTAAGPTGVERHVHPDWATAAADVEARTGVPLPHAPS